MSGCNTVVWLNDEEARFSQFAAAGAPSQEIPARPFRVRRGQPSPHAAARHGQDSFYSDIAAALVAAEAILLVGPGEAKLALLRHLRRHHPALESRVLGLETVGPDGGCLTQFAQQYFGRRKLRKPPRQRRGMPLDRGDCPSPLAVAY